MCHFSPFIDEESDWILSLSKFQAHGINADQGACGVGPSWRVLLAPSQAHCWEPGHTWARWESLRPAGACSSSQPTLASPGIALGPFCPLTGVAFPFPVETWSLSPSGVDLPMINTI